MRIVIVNSHVSERIGGSEVQCDLLARGLTRLGYCVKYIAPRAKHVNLGGYPYRIEPVAMSARGIGAAILAARPDIVYWRFNKHCFRSVAARCSAHDIPLIFAVAHINDLMPWVAKPGRPGLRGRCAREIRKVQSWWNHAGFRHVCALTVNNLDHIGLSPVRDAIYIPNGMSESAEVFHWPRPFVAWVANIKPAKRPETFVALSRSLADFGIDALMIGNIQSQEYRWIADKSATPHNFFFLGPKSVAEVNGVLAASRLHVHTCEPEGFGNIFIQAWLQSKPSISLEVDPGGYIQSQGFGAVAQGDLANLEELVVEWATDPSRCSVAGNRAHNFAREFFTPDKMVFRVEELMKRVASKS